jgi:2-oxoglutarate dehydrogenase E1 component
MEVVVLSAKMAEPAKSLNIWNTSYIEELHEQWLADPDALTPEWRSFFEGFSFGASQGGSALAELAESDSAGALQAKLLELVQAYRMLGHFSAAANPLSEEAPELIEDLLPSHFGISDAALKLPIGPQLRKELCQNDEYSNGEEMLAILRDTYCHTVGAECSHILQEDARQWLERELESNRCRPSFSRERKLEIHKGLVDAELFETFTHRKYMGQKRFSLEGGETMIAAVQALVHLCPELGVEEVVVGMAHRGRLNVLANLMGMTYEMIFSEFEGYFDPDTIWGDGDVKYHKGYSSKFLTRSGEKVHLSLTPNPSHLEAVNPVVEGKTRSKQRQRNDRDSRGKVIPLLIHGDAAFAGQGIVAETLNLSQLEGYRTGGTIHFIINNQIGFTTSPEDARSSRYATDVAKMIECPIFHVNGDDPEAVVHVMELALRFRQQFKKDVVIDMLCYRRHGHNEGDEPSFTQPEMYKIIKKKSSTRLVYLHRLVEEGVISVEEEKQIAAEFEQHLQGALDNVRQGNPEIIVQAYENLWEGLNQPFSFEPVDTSVDKETLMHVARKISDVPEDFKINRKIGRRLPKRVATADEGGNLDWAFGEGLAFGTLLHEKVPVRLSGQDSVRGTFSHRHSSWFDTETGAEYCPYNNISEDQSRFCVYNSMLSEAAVLGFEFGYALSDPYMLVIWEAQFGDFANGAQVIVDQFITGSESKWQRTNGMVMLLPHGSEGQGPEHSNAYLERYLMACAEKNIQVANLTTPAQLFHALRRQVKRSFRRPLIIMSPKSLLRHPKVVSPLSDFTDGRFQEILDDAPEYSKAKRVVLCSGKVFYDLDAYRQKHECTDVALIRLEQFYPFHSELLKEVIARYDNAELVWAQEESQNRGGWNFVMPRMLSLFPGRSLMYVGREASASPATGLHSRHVEEQNTLVESAFDLSLKCPEGHCIHSITV